MRIMHNPKILNKIVISYIFLTSFSLNFNLIKVIK